MNQETPRSTIEFKLIPKAKPSLKLLRRCILDNLPDHYGRTDLERSQLVLKAFRNQLYRAIKANPEERRRLTYVLNCPPSGFEVQPKTKVCKNPKVCPWCFVRLRLVKAYRALLQVPTWARAGHVVVAWAREVRNISKLPFLRSNYGPHTWCNALVTVQMVVPFVKENALQGQSKVLFYHVGIQVIPETCNLSKELGRYCIRPSLRMAPFGEVTPDNVLEALKRLLSLDWMALYRPQNLDTFEQLMNGFKRSQLIRISQYKPESADATG